jgi:hypothetical protein
VEERNHQVNLMREIYTNAAFVLVWLGDDCGTALKALADPKVFEHPFQTTEHNALVAKAADSLINAEYWSRIWIVQEFVLARDLIIASGPVFQDWKSLVLSRPDFQLSSPYILEGTLPFDAVRQMKTDYSMWRIRGGYLSFKDLLFRFRHHSSTDPRDMVYGILGLVDLESDPDWLEEVRFADYSLSVVQLYEKLLRCWHPYHDETNGSIHAFADGMRRALDINQQKAEKIMRDKFDFLKKSLPSIDIPVSFVISAHVSSFWRRWKR